MNRQGMTLIELLVTLVLSAVLLASVYQVIHLSWTCTTLGHEETELSRSTRAFLDSISRDLRNARPPGSHRLNHANVRSNILTKNQSTATIVGSNRAILICLSVHSVAQSHPQTLNQVPAFGRIWSGYGESSSLANLLCQSFNGERDVERIRVTSNAMGRPIIDERLKIAGFQRLSFKYFDGREWLPSWDRGTTLPVAIEVQIHLAGDKGAPRISVIELPQATTRQDEK